MNIANDKNVQLLSKTMDLDLPKYYIEITDYYEIDNHIVITKAKVLDCKGKMLSLANNKKLVNMIHKFPIRFIKE